VSASDPWDAYAPFYDWENARTLGRRDVPFWTSVARRERGRLLELGCGTGRLLIPIARARPRVFGVDQSREMLAVARARARRLARSRRPHVIRGDVRTLPFASSSFGVVLASYGMLQSILRDRDLDDALNDAVRVLRPGGLFGVDLVAELPRWAEYGAREQFSGVLRGARIRLIETVRQDRRRRLTIFNEEFIVSRGRRVERRKFTLTFRTLPLPQMVDRIERAGCRLEALLGDYRGTPWDESAEAWVILARKL
jgi:SAM-dependent methyltransferase